MYQSIQDKLPNEAPLLNIIAQIIWECEMRGVHHAGQQNYIVEKILKEDYGIAVQT